MTKIRQEQLADQITHYGMARQAIMNGNFDVWQRGTSVALIDSTVTYQADRWLDYVGKDGGTLPTLTRSRQNLTPGSVQNAFYLSRLTTNGAGTSLGVNSWGYYQQKIEHGVRSLCGSGKKVTVSFRASSDIATKRIGVTLMQYYGSGGSPSAAEFILSTPITLTSTPTEYTVTFTTNTLSGKTFGTNNDDYIGLRFYYMWGTTLGNTYVQTGVTVETFVGAGNIDIAQVQLCSGDVALPFQPKSFEEELRACQRYYEKSYNYEIAPATATTLGAYYSSIHTAYLLSDGHVKFSITKRTTPTVTLYSSNGTTSGVGSEYNNASTFVADRAISVSGNIGNNGMWAGGTAGNFTTTAFPNGSFMRFHWVADAEL